MSIPIGPATPGTLRCVFTTDSDGDPRWRIIDEHGSCLRTSHCLGSIPGAHERCRRQGLRVLRRLAKMKNGSYEEIVIDLKRYNDFMEKMM